MAAAVRILSWMAAALIRGDASDDGGRGESILIDGGAGDSPKDFTPEAKGGTGSGCPDDGGEVGWDDAVSDGGDVEAGEDVVMDDGIGKDTQYCLVGGPDEWMRCRHTAWELRLSP